MAPFIKIGPASRNVMTTLDVVLGSRIRHMRYPNRKRAWRRDRHARKENDILPGDQTAEFTTSMASRAQRGNQSTVDEM